MGDTDKSQVVGELIEYWHAALDETKSIVSLVQTGKPTPLDSARRRVAVVNSRWLRYFLHTMRFECRNVQPPHHKHKEWLRTQVVILRMAGVEIKIPERLLE